MGVNAHTKSTIIMLKARLKNIRQEFDTWTYNYFQQLGGGREEEEKEEAKDSIYRCCWV